MKKTIKNEIAEVTFDTLGVQLDSFQVNGKEYLWQKDPAYWIKSAPVLFPYIGPVQERPIEFYGKPCDMPRHGFIKDTEMTCVLEEKERIICETQDNEDTWKMYPYHFKFTSDYQLQGDKLTVSYTVENTGDQEMIYLIGGHPGINCPMEDGAAFTDYEVIFNKKEADPKLIDGKVLPLSYDLFPIDAYIIDDVQSDKVWLLNKNTKKGLAFEFHNFKMLALWSTVGKEAPFVCLEPWCNGTFDSLANVELSEKKHVQKLAPGKKETYSFSFQPTEGVE